MKIFFFILNIYTYVFSIYSNKTYPQSKIINQLYTNVQTSVYLPSFLYFT